MPTALIAEKGRDMAARGRPLRRRFPGDEMSAMVRAARPPNASADGTLMSDIVDMWTTVGRSKQLSPEPRVDSSRPSPGWKRSCRCLLWPASPE